MQRKAWGPRRNPPCSSLGFFFPSQLLKVTGTPGTRVSLLGVGWICVTVPSRLPPHLPHRALILPLSPRSRSRLTQLVLVKVLLLTRYLHCRPQGEHACLVGALSYPPTPLRRLFSGSVAFLPRDLTLYIANLTCPATLQTRRQATAHSPVAPEQPFASLVSSSGLGPK